MLFVTTCAILLGLCIERYRSYREKIASWERLNDVFTDASQDSYAIFREGLGVYFGMSTGEPHWSEWIAGRFPSLDIVTIGMGSSEGGQRSIAEAFDYLRDFPTVTDAELGYSDVTDADICVLATHCHFLSQLDVECTELTDASVACIAKFKRLKTLNISETHLTGAGFRQISASCSELNRLDAYSIPITDAGLAEIATCKSLVELNLTYNNLSPQSLKVLASADMPQLRRLSLDGIYSNYVKDEKAEFRHVISLIESNFPDAVVSY